jgi:short subunit dehydrogenase-like uncharacterized protein
MDQREFDVVLYGASGFVGRLTAAELAATAQGARIALAGRTRSRVEAVRAELGLDWPVLVADAGDPAALAAMAERTAVVATAVGPYLRHGRPLAQACADAGTHYCDLSGETLFVRSLLDGVEEAARRTGARIVPSCGFDSVPSDLGVLLLHHRVRQDGEGTLRRTVLVVESARGGVGGSTIDSGRAEAEAIEQDPSLKRALADPYGLSPDRDADPRGEDEHAVRVPRRDPFLGRWVGPFVLGPHNERMVRRTWALLGHAYGPGFRYEEVLGAGTGPLAPIRAAATAGAQGAALAGLGSRAVRTALQRLLPAPGSGPSERTRQRGAYRLRIHAETTTGARYLATVADRRDPGYDGTAVLFAQAALGLARQEAAAPGGVLTPAVALGPGLADPLRERGLVLSVARAR